MKRILIPTVFHQDTLAAVRLAAELNTQGDLVITLMTAFELSDSITDLLFLAPHHHIDEQARHTFMDSVREVINARNERIELKEHHQFGVARPVISQVLERLNTDMIIVPRSFQESKNYIHKSLLSVFNKLKYPLMLLPLEKSVPSAIQRALYLQPDAGTEIGTLAQFPFHVIHQDMLSETMQGQSLQNIINNFNIDLVVQSKRSRQIPQNNELSAELQLPVLTV